MCYAWQPGLPAILLAIALGIASRPGWPNALIGHPSPYLAMHGEDPVDWQTWGKSAIVQAGRENRLLFVSSGYFACHWCHVMQAESYRNPEIAAYLNAHYVPVKVDRELRPALDAHLIDFVKRTQGVAGWPLNVFLTPDGHPLAGTTYLPPGRFLDYLKRLQRSWQDDRDGLRTLARGAAQALAGEKLQTGKPLSAGQVMRYRNALVEGALALGDEMEGGFGNKAKFPASPQLEALLDEYRRRPNPQLRQFLRLTLDQMASQALRDHIGGGFFRYTVDPSWQVPHFEKMLYDNAQLVRLFGRAARVLAEPVYEAVARETLAFMLRELWSKDAAFIASLSSVDDQGEEGGYYLWDMETVASVLSGPEYAAARLAWNLKGPPTFDGGYLPVTGETPAAIADELGISTKEVEGRLASARQKLFRERSRRAVPMDTKRLAAWNGLALEALADAALLWDKKTYLPYARELRDYLGRRLWDGKTLRRAEHAGRAVGDASLEDYAQVAAGLLAWAQASGERDDLELVRRIVAEAWRRFRGQNGWRLGEDVLIPGGADEPVLPDGPLPSPSATLLQVSLRLAERVGDEPLRQRALAVLARDYPAIESNPVTYASHINLLAWREPELSLADQPGAQTPSPAASP